MLAIVYVGSLVRGFVSLHLLATRVMDANAIRQAVQRFRFERFDVAVEEFDYYIQRFETELDLHNLLQGDATADARRSLLLSRIGPDAFKVLVDHFRPDAVNTKTYVVLKRTLQTHFKKDTCVIAERVKFTLRHRKEEETVTQFLISLRAIAGKCAFGQSLDERLRDQLVIGISNDSWQQEIFRLHPTNDATLQQVEQSALIVEQAFTQQQQIRAMTKSELKQETTTCRVKAKPNKRGTGKQRFEQMRDLHVGVDCLKCGFPRHMKGESCPAASSSCHTCGLEGHFARVCIKSGKAIVKKGKGKQVNSVETETREGTPSSGEEESGVLNTIMAIKSVSAKVEVQLNGRPITMLYDPGASRSIISKRMWIKIGSPPLKPTSSLVAYTNVTVDTCGEAVVAGKLKEKVQHLAVVVVRKHDFPLFGLDWCLSFGLELPSVVRLDRVNQLGEPQKQSEIELEALISEYQELFGDDLGVIKGHKAVVHLKSNITPKVYSARPLPFAMQESVEIELRRLVDKSVIEPVDTQSHPVEWASPIVCVRKASGAIRICGDFKATLNPCIYVDPHPLPRFEDLMSKITGSKHFTKIDLSEAYLQMEVDEQSRKYFVIATHIGYFQYNRLPFGVNFAPAYFQKTMEKILEGIPYTAVFIDDILVGGKSKEEHFKILRDIFHRLRLSNIRIRKSKCAFFQKEISYLGHRIDEQGIHPTEEHLQAIKCMPTPSNKKELRSFLGSVNYYSRFIPHLQAMCAPLHDLVKVETKWAWKATHDRLFTKLKHLLTSKDTLIHYSLELPVIVTTDASDLGVGAVLSHKFPDGTEKPVAYASRRLSKREQQYAAIDKEALAIVFGIIKFHQYVYGRHFTLQTDHKPLERILGAHREIPRMVANRLQRWALTLSAYDYELKVVQGKENVVADFLSRLPLSSTNASAAEKVGESDVLLNVRLGDLSLTRKDLQRESQRDEVLKRVIAYVDRGWPVDRSKVSPEFTTFWEKRESLSFENGILLWSGRIVVPYSLRKQVLTLLHEGHPGVWAMRALARFYVWWPRIDSEIEVFLKGCYSCQENRPRAPETLLYSWNSPSEPWARIHIDYAGPFEGMYWLVVVDSYSKWVEIKRSTSMTAITTIKLLREIFCQLGIPKVIVSDNGPQFVSQEFQDFCNQNYITHIKSTPYHPKTNGLAERMVRTFKERLRAGKNSSADLDLRLQRFLLSYRNTPHKSTGRSPAELLMGHRLRSKLDLLKPDANSSSDKSSVMQKLYHDNKAQPRWFFQDEAVWVQKPSQQGYVAGIIKKRYSDYSYLVDINGVIRRKHADQLRVRHKEQPDEPADEPVIEERDTLMHYTHFNHSDCSDTHPQRDIVKNPDSPSPVMVPSEENEPELQSVVSLPQQGSVGQEVNETGG